ncbi:MAG: hypothetical protein OXD29_00155 [Roseovarius sp.]|nr:hypothetical protein [Roseovarius sp.]MCY4206348.1 hypothetical protein [Roseovarius sp.]MCY4206352.1 hypothetical protein [Roseovarius sp.]
MSEQNGLANLTRQVAVLEERMNAMNDSYDKGWKLIEAQLREDSAKRDAEMARRDAEMAKRDAEMAKRETALTRWLIGVISAATAIIIAVVLSTS